MIKCGNCEGRHQTAADVRACYDQRVTSAQRALSVADGALDAAGVFRAADELDRAVAEKRAYRNGATQQAAATEKQISFLRSLVSDRDIEQLSGANYERAFDISTDSGKFIGKHEASELIDALLALPKTAVAAVREEDLEGVHFVDGQYLKVQRAVHGSGRLYAKVWVPETEEWKYRGRKPLSRLSADTKLNAEQAARWGKLYGRCVFCSLPLTDERSIAVGYGPVCAEHHGLPWGDSETPDSAATRNVVPELHDRFRCTESCGDCENEPQGCELAQQRRARRREQSQRAE